jgi:hypothetical protein
MFWKHFAIKRTLNHVVSQAVCLASALEICRWMKGKSAIGEIAGNVSSHTSPGKNL